MSNTYPPGLKDFCKHVAKESHKINEVQQLSDLLDFVIVGFSIDVKENPLQNHDTKYLKHLQQSLYLLSKTMQEELQNKKWVDLLGRYYEYISNNGNKGMLGQFFTPEHVCNFMSMCTPPKTGQKAIDPCCGSGRMLLAAYCNTEEKPFLLAKDLDLICCKITLVNLFMHGAYNSEAVCGNALSNEFYKGWKIDFSEEHSFLCIKEITEEESYIQNNSFISAPVKQESRIEKQSNEQKKKQLILL